MIDHLQQRKQALGPKAKGGKPEDECVRTALAKAKLAPVPGLKPSFSAPSLYVPGFTLTIS